MIKETKGKIKSIIEFMLSQPFPEPESEHITNINRLTDLVNEILPNNIHRKFLLKRYASYHRLYVEFNEGKYSEEELEDMFDSINNVFWSKILFNKNKIFDQKIELKCLRQFIVELNNQKKWVAIFALNLVRIQSFVTNAILMAMKFAFKNGQRLHLAD